MKNWLLIVAVGILVSSLLLLTGCKKDNSPSGPAGPGDNTDIPADPGGSAPTPTINNVQPSGSIAKSQTDPYRIKINMLGIIDPTTGSPIHFSLSKAGYVASGANLFVTEDSTLQGIKLSSVGGGTTLSADVVFVVDNSGSMGEEADSIATKIIAFSTYLAASGMNVKVGCVGYQYGDVNGAMNLTDATSLRTYLQRPNRTGTDRTVGTGGTDSSKLAASIAVFPKVYDENGILGVAFADTFFSWRSGAQRIYINFTDEGIQTASQYKWTVAGLKSRWTPSKGSIHTVFSVGSSYWNGSVPDTSMDTENYTSWQDGVWERPWSLSHFSGGTVKIVHSDGHDLDLTTLPVTGALASSYLVEFVSSNPSIPHTVTITVKTPTADGKQVFSGIKY